MLLYYKKYDFVYIEPTTEKPEPYYTFIAPVGGTYKLETWGAQGGNSIINGSIYKNNSYGGYSVGTIKLNKNDKLYIYVGGKGTDGVINVNDSLGGYNGGGIGHWDKTDDEASGGGGGATHIATINGLLSTLENNKENVIIVSGGSGGASWNYQSGNGGGFEGTNGLRTNLFSAGGTQTTGYKFGQGGDGSNNMGSPGGGGGGGFYGGAGGYIENASDYSKDAIPGAGGSGYIGNSLLTNKSMYCYDCAESNEETTKTISTTCHSDTPISNCAKEGNGFARITLLS